MPDDETRRRVAEVEAKLRAALDDAERRAAEIIAAAEDDARRIRSEAEAEAQRELERVRHELDGPAG